MSYELAVQSLDGVWELVGDYPTREAAIEAALEAYPHVWHDDEDGAIFGLSCDPLSGHYEERIAVYPAPEGDEGALRVWLILP
jgi:hypothetical protein